MHRIAVLLVLCSAVIFGSLLACTCTNGNGAARSDRAASIVGTVTDAATGKPVADAAVEGPGGKKTRSDERGRFELGSFEVGTTGEVTATTRDGRSASVTLRRLAAGRLEIVLGVHAH